tara:strand:- start:3487 stop:4005 length:519 start_codon:yes stop_codon:yes gene_type:complete
MLTNLIASTAALTTAELKAQMRVDSSTEDTLIDGYGSAAQKYIEDRTRQTATTSQWQIETRAYVITLPIGNLTGIVAVDAIDKTGAVSAVTDYRINSTTSLATVVIGSGVAEADFRIRWNAETANPEQMKQCIAMLAAHWYERRESVVSGTISAPAPHGLDMLCDSFTLAGC